MLNIQMTIGTTCGKTCFERDGQWEPLWENMWKVDLAVNKPGTYSFIRQRIIEHVKLIVIHQHIILAESRPWCLSAWYS